MPNEEGKERESEGEGERERKRQTTTPTPTYSLIITTDQISLIDAQDHVANAEACTLGRTAILDVGDEHAATKFGMFALDDHDAQAL